MWSILMSRFILNLRRTVDHSVGVASRTSGRTSGRASDMTTIRFALTYFDNLSAPLYLDDEDDYPIDEGIAMMDRRPSCEGANVRLARD